jgi:hypothetical protein
MANASVIALGLTAYLIGTLAFAVLGELRGWARKH